MRDSGHSTTGPGEAEQPPLLEFALDITDHAGRRRQGRAIIARTLSAGAQAQALPEGEEFRIVILSEPTEQTIVPPQGIVATAPLKPLRFTKRILKDASAAYMAGASKLGLTPADVELLSQGRLFTTTPIDLKSEEIFAGGAVRLDLMARDLIESMDMAECVGSIAMALAAPEEPKAALTERLDELRDLIAGVGDIEVSDETAEAQAAIEHLSELVFAKDKYEFLEATDRLYPKRHMLMEDVYLLRALTARPREARELLAARRFLSKAAVPREDADLSLDRALVQEELTFAVLAVEPSRLPTVRAALERFRKKYVAAYKAHHTRTWAERGRLHSRLLEARPHVEALQRLNSIAELGAPLGVGALAAYEELMGTTSGCELIAGIEEIVATDGVCPVCGLTLAEEAPRERGEDILRRIDRACERQMARLSSSAVQQVLRRSADPRIEQFLRVVQASQLSNLPDILDDELVGYLRRMLVEWRVQEALEPVMRRVQTGAQPDVDEAQAAMQDVSRVFQRAFLAVQRALPAPPEADDPPKGKGRRRKR